MNVTYNLVVVLGSFVVVVVAFCVVAPCETICTEEV